MNRNIPGIRKPVTRLGAENSLLLMLLGFAGSVTLTRLFLEIAGYPQLGTGGLHIAHVLWGGLLLFVSSILPLTFANRWVYTLSALLSGIGVGLFIDEVGKFITQENDYFYPPAAPLVYAFFLITVLIYIQVRRRVSRDPRAELYRSLHLLEDVLDHDLDNEEHAELVTRLQYVAEKAEHPDLARLARQLLQFVAKEEIYLAPRLPNVIVRLQIWFAKIEEKHLSQLRMRAGLAGAIGAIGLVSLSKLGQVLLSRVSTAPLEQTLQAMVEDQILTNSGMIYFFLVRVGLEGMLGILLFLAALLLAVGHERRAIAYAYFGLLVSLGVVNILVFYFDQFSTITIAMMQFGILVAVLYYRRRFLPVLPPLPEEKES